MTQKSGYSRWIAPIFLILVVLLSFSKILFHENYVLVEGQDLTGQAYPWFHAASYWFQNRTLLLWDPYVFSGKPNAGEPQTGLFYPINWFFFAWPFENGQLPPEALEAYIILNFCLMCLFVYFLARSFGISTLGAVVSAVVCGLGGMSSKIHSWLDIQSSFIWLPLILIFYNKANKSIDRKQGFIFLLLCALCLALSFLAGHHQPPIQAAIFLGIFALYLKGSKQHTRDQFPLLAGLFVVAALAALLASIQIFPSAEWGMRAYRWAGDYGPLRGGEEIPHFVLEKTEKLHPQDLLSLLVPYASTTVNLYIGPAAILLACAGAIFSHKKEARFFLIASLAFLFFSMGKFSILHTWLYTYIPGIWFAREGIYFLIPFVLSIAMLAGYGLDAVAQELRDPSNAQITGFIRLMIQMIAIVLSILFAFSVVAVFRDETLLRDDRLEKGTKLMLYLTLLSILLGSFYLRKISKAVFQVLLVAIIVIDLGSEISQAIPLQVSGEGQAVTPDNIYRNNELANVVRNYQAREMFRLDDLSGVLPSNAGDAWLIYSTTGYTTTIDRNYFDLRNSGWGQFSNASAVLNTRYFISPVQLDGIDPLWSKDEMGIFPNRRAVARVFTISAVRIFSAEEKLLEFMNTPLFNPHATALFLESDWKKAPKSLQENLNAQSIQFDMSKFEYIKEDTAFRYSDPEIQSIYGKPWGWDPGDRMNGSFKLDSDTDVSASLSYFAGETDCSLSFVLRHNDRIREEPLVLTANASKTLTHRDLHLGTLRSGTYQFEIQVPQECSSKLDSVELASNHKETLESTDVKILSYKPHKITISTSLNNAALLVLSDVFYPGWVAQIDHVDVPIYRVDYALRAVAVEPGKHIVEFCFRPTSIYLGIAVSSISLAAVLLCLWLNRKKLNTPPT